MNGLICCGDAQGVCLNTIFDAAGCCDDGACFNKFCAFSMNVIIGPTSCFVASFMNCSHDIFNCLSTSLRESNKCSIWENRRASDKVG